MVAAGHQEEGVKARLLVMSSPEAPELSVLQSLPPEMKVVGIGRSPEDFPGWTLCTNDQALRA